MSELALLGSMNPQVVWDHYREQVSKVDLTKVFGLSETEIKLFNYLKLQAIESQADALAKS